MISSVHCGESGRDETDYFSQIKNVTPKNLAQINKTRMQSFHTARPWTTHQMLSPVWYFPSLSLLFSQFVLETCPKIH